MNPTLNHDSSPPHTHTPPSPHRTQYSTSSHPRKWRRQNPTSNSAAGGAGNYYTAQDLQDNIKPSPSTEVPSQSRMSYKRSRSPPITSRKFTYTFHQTRTSNHKPSHCNPTPALPPRPQPPRYSKSTRTRAAGGRGTGIRRRS